MISAFGIEHGEVSKSYRKLAPKLIKANRRIQDRYPVGRDQPLDQRLRENYAQWRVNAGAKGAHGIEQRQGDKEGAQAVVTGIGNISRREGRTLP